MVRELAVKRPRNIVGGAGLIYNKKEDRLLISLGSQPISLVSEKASCRLHFDKDGALAAIKIESAKQKHGFKLDNVFLGLETVARLTGLDPFWLKKQAQKGNRFTSITARRERLTTIRWVKSFKARLRKQTKNR